MKHLRRYMDAVKNGDFDIENGELKNFQKFIEFSVEVEKLKRNLILIMKIKCPKKGPKDWYIGITGQTKEERLSGHHDNFPDLEENTWCEVTATTTFMAREIEKRLKQMGYRTFTRKSTEDSNHPGNLTLRPRKVYAFIHNFID